MIVDGGICILDSAGKSFDWIILERRGGMIER